MDVREHTLPKVLSATTMIGDGVKNLQGEDLGKVEEFMLDLDSGRIAYFEGYYRERGIKILPGNLVEAFSGENSRLTHVELKSGETLAADLVVAGVGVEPNTEMFSRTPIKVADGILVNEYL